MVCPPVEKNVEAQLIKDRNHRRRPGDIPYPLVYSRDMLNFDNWDHMFLVSCCRSLTMHQFDTPPSNVLDLGCGGGFWAIEAAKQWKNSTITGFDLKAIQPNLSQLDAHGDVGQRVNWVHGNLLDKLPFPVEHFEFVRIVGIGLGVPEDEWQYVLEEVSRVMKPGAVLEIIEEDLIFPGCVDATASTSSDGWSVSNSIISERSSNSWPRGSKDHHPLKTTSSEATLRDSSSMLPSATQPNWSMNFSSPALEHFSDVQDHTKLKAAWEAMLTHRFLAPQLVTVLPFYLSSTFIDVRTHNALHIPLPPNSRPKKPAGSPVDGPAYRQDSLDPEAVFRMQSSSRSSKASDEDSMTSPRSPRLIPSWAPMHLAKTVRTVIACKESIWIEYERLYGNDPSVPPVARRFNRTGRGNQKEVISMERQSVRENFETEWLHWEHDMEDRINMRGFLVSECKWEEPSGHTPDWRIWRDTLTITTQGTSISVGSTDLCRSLRGFVSWKPS